MSFIGCTFICKNEKCKCFETGFSMTGLWPLGDLNILIEKADDKEYKEQLKRKQAAGIKYAKINFPNTLEIPTVGYSIEKFCKECKRIQTCDIKNYDDETPETCDICNKPYITFQEACGKEDDEGNLNGLECPFCGEKMFQERWYVNEKEDEERIAEEQKNIDDIIYSDKGEGKKND